MRGVGYGVVGLVALGTTWLVGASAAGWALPYGANASAVGLAAGVGVAVALPMVVSKRIVRALADRTPRRGPIHAATMLGANVLTLGALVGLAPDLAQHGIEQAGDWPLFDQDVPVLSQALAAHHIGTPPVVPEAVEEQVVEVPLEIGESEQPPPPEPMDAAGVFAAAADSVVVIETESAAEGVVAQFMPTLRGHGSGFAVAPDLIVSNFHVAGDATALAVRTRDGQRVPARRVASLPQDDLVLLQLDGVALQPLALAPERATIGSQTWAIGAPLGLEYSLTEGIVSGERDMSGTPFLQMQTTVAPGSSGGPLLDAHARVVGVNTAVASPGLSLAVQAERVEALLSLDRSVDAEWLPLLPQPITLVRADFPDDMLPTERSQAEAALETITAMLSHTLALEDASGRLDLAPRDCHQEGLAMGCSTLTRDLGMALGMLRFLPDTVEASFTDVPRTDGSTGDLTLALHPGSIPHDAVVPDASRE